MSKLNDSTLKILKKYRLDTDMSVFGNENKLYDVVKVMDDMVGGQVSDVKANMPYFDSTVTVGISYWCKIQDSATPVYTPTKSGMTINKPVTDGYHEYVFDGLSLKYLGDNATSDIMKYGYLLLSDDTKLYLGISDVARLYYDVGCTNEIPSDYNLTQSYVFVSYVIVRNDILNKKSAKPICYGLNYYYLFGVSSSDVNITAGPTNKKFYYAVSPNQVKSIISSPEIIKDLLSKSKLYTRPIYPVKGSLPLDQEELNVEIKHIKEV